MLALISVWLALLSLALSAAMLAYRPLFSDWVLTLVLYFGAPGSLCLAFLVLWASRGEASPDPAIAAQRVQAKVAIGLNVLAVAIGYGLVIFAARVPGVER